MKILGTVLAVFVLGVVDAKAQSNAFVTAEYTNSFAKFLKNVAHVSPVVKKRWGTNIVTLRQGFHDLLASDGVQSEQLDAYIASHTASNSPYEQGGHWETFCCLLHA